MLNVKTGEMKTTIIDRSECQCSNNLRASGHSRICHAPALAFPVEYVNFLLFAPINLPVPEAPREAESEALACPGMNVEFVRIRDGCMGIFCRYGFGPKRSPPTPARFWCHSARLRPRCSGMPQRGVRQRLAKAASCVRCRWHDGHQLGR